MVMVFVTVMGLRYSKRIDLNNFVYVVTVVVVVVNRDSKCCCCC